MNRSKRILILLCALMLTLSVFASCSKNKGDGSGTTAAPQNPSMTPSDEASLIEALLPETNYGGKEIKIITMEGYNTTGHLVQTEMTSDAVNRVAFDRTTYINERYDVVITLVENDNLVRDVKLSHDDGDKEYHLIYPHPTSGITTLMTEGLLCDLRSFDNLHLDREWWNQSQVENYTTNGKLYLGVSDYTITGQGFAGLVYNKEVYEAQAFTEDIYKIVMDGNWTIDLMIQMVEQANIDLNGAEGNAYGLIFHKGYAERFMYALGENILTKEDGKFVRGLTTKQMPTIAEKLHSLINNRPNVLVMNADNATFPLTQMWTSFASGNSLFLTFDIGVLYPMLNDLSFDVGYLPLPKLGESADEDYRVVCGGGLIGIPSDTEDAEMSSVILEALSIYSYEELRPAYYDSILNGKLATNADDGEMLEFLHSKKFFDFGYTLDANGDAKHMLARCVIDDQDPGTVAGYIVSNKPLLDAIKDLANTIT